MLLLPAEGGASRSHATTNGFPGGASGKEPTCQCRRCKRYGFDPWVRKIPWRRKWQPIPVFLLGNSMDGGAHRWQPTRLPHSWDSPGKNTGVGCHFLLQCMKVKSESEVTQSCLTLHNPMDCSLPGSSIHGTFQAKYSSGVPSPSP